MAHGRVEASMHRIGILIVLGLAAIAMPAQAQGSRAQSIQEKDMLALRDQPGYVPNPTEEQLDIVYQRQPVFYRTHEAPGTIVVNTVAALSLSGPGQQPRHPLRHRRRPRRLSMAGLHKITRKAEWPDWRPPPEMIQRQPYLPRFMAGGPGNPLGARALYIGATVYRIHGTNQPQTIGHAVSSGCFRLVNPDIIDLYDRVPVGTRVVVQHAPKL